jgi:hypothetical protein
MPLVHGQHPTEQVTPEVALRAKVAALERRIATLERETRIPMTTVAGVTGGRDGSMAGSADTPRLWLKVAGTWRYTTLT